MRMGVLREQLAASLAEADQVLLFQPPDVDWDLQSVVDQLGQAAQLFRSIEEIIDLLLAQAQAGEHILIMSNGAFGGIHQRVLDALSAKHAKPD